MNKKELISAVAEATGLSKANVEAVISSMTNVIIDQVKAGNEVKTEIGKFLMVETKAREGVNPQKPGEKIKIPAKKVLKFKVFKSFKTL